MPFAEAKAAAKGLGGTINDFFVAGALAGAAQYHADRAGETDKLRSAMPVSTRKGGTAGGNHFALTTSDIRMISDPVEAFAALETLIEERPDDPAAYRTVAAIVWLRILFLRSAVLVDHYLAGSISRSSGKPQEPPEDLDWSFQTHIGRAIELSESAVQRAPDDPDGHYELGASVGLAASYQASICRQ